MKYLTDEGVAKLLDCSKKTVASMARAGKLPHIKIGNERRYPEDKLQKRLDEMLSENCSDPNVSEQSGARTIGKQTKMHLVGSKG